MITAIIDVGSNTVHLTLFKCENDGTFHALLDEKAFAGLAGHVEDHFLSAKGITALCENLDYFRGVVRGLDIAEIHVFATAVFRQIRNAAEVLERARNASGLEIEIISGEEEARLSFTGARHFTKLRDGVVADIGGASTEIIAVRDGKPVKLSVMPDGCLSLRKKHIAGALAQKKEIRRICGELHTRLNGKEYAFAETAPALCCVGGTARAVYKLAKELALATNESRELPVPALHSITRRLSNNDTFIYNAVCKVVPERFFTLLPGALIISELAAQSAPEKIIISKGGVREGFLLDRIISRSIAR
jgi:exopolyphosphatase/guanosine-5'-triphosphate,3'-diphosphate pyrophosphatase